MAALATWVIAYCRVEAFDILCRDVNVTLLSIIPNADLEVDALPWIANLHCATSL